jgi:hypothetical protein
METNGLQWRSMESKSTLHNTVLLQVRQDIVNIGCSSLSAAVSAEGMILGFLVLILYFYFFMGKQLPQHKQCIPHLQ